MVTKKIDVLGQFETDISVTSAKVSSKFLEVKNGRCILGMLLQESKVSFTLGQVLVLLVTIVMK